MSTVSSPFRLDGKVALVTGSTRGLGKEIAVTLARAGAKTAMNFANDRETALSAYADLQQIAEESLLVQGDVTDESSVDRIAGQVESTLGPIDVLVVNATCSQHELPFEQYDWAGFQSMLDYFVKSPVLLTKRCLPGMKQNRWGRIIHITSEVVALASAEFSAYVAAKGGQTALALSNAREFAPFGITVNMLAPGWIPVERHANADPASLAEYKNGVPAGRMGAPQDLAPAVVFLASNEAQFTTGQTLAINGGNTIRRRPVFESMDEYSAFEQ